MERRERIREGGRKRERGWKVSDTEMEREEGWRERKNFLAGRIRKGGMREIQREREREEERKRKDEKENEGRQQKRGT